MILSPVPVLAEAFCDPSRAFAEAWESTIPGWPRDTKRTLAAGNINFMSAWRNVKTLYRVGGRRVRYVVCRVAVASNMTGKVDFPRGRSLAGSNPAALTILLPVPVLAELLPVTEALRVIESSGEAREGTKPPVVQNGTLAAGNNPGWRVNETH